MSHLNCITLTSLYKKLASTHPLPHASSNPKTAFIHSPSYRIIRGKAQLCTVRKSLTIVQMRLAITCIILTFTYFWLSSSLLQQWRMQNKCSGTSTDISDTLLSLLPPHQDLLAPCTQPHRWAEAPFRYPVICGSCALLHCILGFMPALTRSASNPLPLFLPFRPCHITPLSLQHQRLEAAQPKVPLAHVLVPVPS